MRYGPFVLDLATRTLIRDRARSKLTPKECRLLATFIAHEGQVLTRRFLMKEVWDTNFIADTRTLEVHVHWLRRKLEGNSGRPTYLHTVRGVGYILRPIGPAG